MRHEIKLKLRGEGINEARVIPQDLVGNLGYQQVQCVTAPNGFMVYEGFKPEKTGIYLLGDSFVENMYVPDGKRLSDVADKELKQLRPGFSVYNGGMSGSSLLNMFNVFVNAILPDILALTIIFPGSISATCDICENTFWNKIADYSSLTGYNDPKEFIEPGDGYNNYIKILRLFVNTANIFGANLLICVPPYNHALKFERFRAINATTRAFCEEADCPWIDMDSWLDENGSYFYDKVHLNMAGSALYGKWLAEQIACIFLKD